MPSWLVCLFVCLLVEGPAAALSSSRLARENHAQSCGSTREFCGGAAYLHYLNNRRLFLAEWPYLPMNSSCFRDSRLLETTNWAGQPVAGVAISGGLSFEFNFYLPQIDKRSSSSQRSVRIYRATLYAPIVTSSPLNHLVHKVIIPAGNFTTDAKLRTWGSECHAYCKDYAVADVTSAGALVWKNREQTLTAHLVVACGDNCENVLVGYQDVPSLLFDYAVCGDTGTQQQYIQEAYLRHS